MMKKEDKKSKDAQRSSIIPELAQPELEVQHERVHSILHLPIDGDWNKAHCCGGLTYIVLGIIVILLSVVEVIVSGFGAATERFYDAQQSGRMVAMLVLSVMAAVTIGTIIYAMVGVSRKHTKPLHTTSIVLIVLAIIQALIAGLAVHVSELDEMIVSRSVTESFYRAKDGDLVQVQLWDGTQSGLECCGLYGPEDYRDPYGPLNFPPDIPASCCPSYTYPNTTLEKAREMCKANGSFYKVGCKVPVLEIVKGASSTVIIVTTLIIVAEVIIAILGAVLSKKRKEEKHDHIEFTPTPPKPADTPQVA